MQLIAAEAGVRIDLDPQVYDQVDDPAGDPHLGVDAADAGLEERPDIGDIARQRA